MPQIAIDVVIPLFNGGNTILRTLRSVLAQRHRPNRIIVVNDGSADDGRARVASEASELVSLIDTPHRGVSHARNLGVAESSGTHVAFLDADDRWHPGKLELQAEVFRRTGAKVVYCASEYIDKEGRGTWRGDVRPVGRGNIYGKIALEGMPLSGSASSVAVERGAFDQVGGFDESLQFSEDTDLWARLAERFEFEFVAEPVVQLLYNPDSATRSPEPGRSFQVLAQHLRFREKIAKRTQDQRNEISALYAIAAYMARENRFSGTDGLFRDLSTYAPVLMQRLSSRRARPAWLVGALLVRLAMMARYYR